MVVLVAAVAPVFPVPRGPGVVVRAAEPAACNTSGPDTGAYTARICITTPSDGAVLKGDITVSGTVEIESGVAPQIKFAQFYFSAIDAENSSAALRDFGDPFTFTLPTDRWSDRAYRLELDVRFIDGYTTDRVKIDVTTSNGVTRIPASTGRWEPKNVESDQPITIAAVGDGAGGQPASYDVTDLIEGWNPQMFLYLGDVYNFGSYTEFLNYYEPTFGRMKNITNPVPGDHEGGRQFQGYRDYWDSNQAYYMATAGSWDLFALNSTERFDQTSPGTAQFDWLKARLGEKDNSACTIVYMHNPRWGQDPAGDNDDLDDLWRLLVSEGVDIVIAGHEHNYQRWAPMDADGIPTPNGTTQFVVGTGGHELVTYSRRDPRLLSNVQGLSGALRLELREGSAGYQFVDTTGTVLDSGDIPCGAETPSEDGTPATATGTIVNTNGLGALCLITPDYDAAAITLLPDGTQVELRGAPIGDWQPIRCADQDGYVVGVYVKPDD